MLNKEKVKLGIAPIAWTNDDMPDLGAENTFEQCVSEMALAGFTGSEVGSKYPKDAAVLKKALDLRGIEICNQWFSSSRLRKSKRNAAHSSLSSKLWDQRSSASRNRATAYRDRWTHRSSDTNT